MKFRSRPIPIFVLGGLLAVLGACSSDTHTDQAVLAHVPADTPYVFANLEPLKRDVLDAWLATANAQIPMQVRHNRQAARELADDSPRLAKLMSAMADEMDGTTWQQKFADAGVDLSGHFAWYGLGMSPVLRGQLKDPAKFQAFITHLAKVSDVTLKAGSIDGIDYRHLDLTELKLQAVASQHEGQFVLALLPMGQDQKQLRFALGADMPAATDAVASRLATLADKQGYIPQGIGYLDTDKLLTDLSSGKDGMVRSLLESTDGAKDRDLSAVLTELAGPACQSDLKRIAARVPQITFGYTHLDTVRASQRMNVNFAPDISAAFTGVRSTLPGLGDTRHAPVDVAIALPMPEIRDFWTAQAQAVAAKPFTCKPLTGMNKAFEQIGQKIVQTAIPPFGNLRGLRAAIDSLGAGSDKDSMPQVQGRLLLALKDPESVLAMAKTMLQPLNSMQLKPDGKPVALPRSLSQFTREPVWLAMNDHALALSIGPQEKDKLPTALSAAGGAAGQLASVHLEGATLAQWIRSAADRFVPVAAQGKDASELGSAKSMRESIDAAAKSYESLKQLNFKVHMDKSGLVVQSETELAASTH
ncbi:MAG: hypothetical protein WCD36_06940 [Rhodanobacteraceae bacterium]